METYLAGALLALFVEALKWIVKRKGVEFTKLMLIAITVIGSIIYGVLATQVQGLQEAFSEALRVFVTATAAYATVWKYLALPALQQITKRTP